MEKLRETFGNNWKCILKRGIFTLLIPLISSFYTILNKYNPNAKILITFIDNLIPFNKYFIIFYATWYVYVAFFLAYLCIFNKVNYWKLLLSLSLGMITAYLIFYLFPTTVPRPVLSGNDIFTNMIRLLYANDNPYNCLPSIHVLNTMLVEIYITLNKNTSRILKIVCNIIGIFIILSTMFIKQHVFLDVLSAAILAYMLYPLINYLLDDLGLIDKLY